MSTLIINSTLKKIRETETLFSFYGIYYPTCNCSYFNIRRVQQILMQKSEYYFRVALSRVKLRKPSYDIDVNSQINKLCIGEFDIF